MLICLKPFTGLICKKVCGMATATDYLYLQYSWKKEEKLLGICVIQSSQYVLLSYREVQLLLLRNPPALVDPG